MTDRPQSLPSKTFTVHIPECGNFRVILGYKHGEVWEVTMVHGKSGSCNGCNLRNISRAMTRYIQELGLIKLYNDLGGNCGRKVISDSIEAESCIDYAVKLIRQHKRLEG